MVAKKELNQESTEEIDEILSAFSQFYILLLLSEEESHGYGLIKKYRNRTGNNLSAGTLYPFLQKLEDLGIVTKSDMSVGKRPKKVYSLTGHGEEFCNRLFNRFSAMTASAIQPTLETCASCGVRVFEGAYHEEVDGKPLAFCCSHCASAHLEERNQ